MKRKITKNNFYQSVRDILETARSNAVRAVNVAMVEAYWQVGQLIVKEEQKGKAKAGYGEYLIRNLSLRLTKDFGEGFSEQGLWNMRQFYATFPILSTLWRELSWSHYKLLIRVESEKARLFYAKEAIQGQWSVRALERQIYSHYYERLLSSRNKSPVRKEGGRNTARLKDDPQDFIKEPYVLEFLGLKSDASYREKDLEEALLSKLQMFLLELGRGFSFVARQKRIATETSEFYIDLVFYNYVLKCFVLIDLKMGKLTHADVGQMDMYVRLFEDQVKAAGDNPTIGIILCAEKDETIVRYSVLKDSQKLFASKYKLYLPTEKELIEELNRDRRSLQANRRTKPKRTLRRKR